MPEKATLSCGFLGYKRGLSKDIIRKLADMFKMRHEAFNRPYKLYVSYTPAYLKTMNTKKKFVMTT